MTKIGRQKVQPEKFGEYVNNLWSAFTLLESKQQIRLLFKDLLSHTEYTKKPEKRSERRNILMILGSFINISRKSGYMQYVCSYNLDKNKSKNGK
jgi:hypothetical protein